VVPLPNREVVWYSSRVRKSFTGRQASVGISEGERHESRRRQGKSLAAKAVGRRGQIYRDTQNRAGWRVGAGPPMVLEVFSGTRFSRKCRESECHHRMKETLVLQETALVGPAHLGGAARKSTTGD